MVAGCHEGLHNDGSLRNVSIKYVYYQSDRWDFWRNSAKHMSPDQNHARTQIDASRWALALARALPPLLCLQGISHLSGRFVRQLAGSSRYPKRRKGPAIAGGYLFDGRKCFMRFVYDPLPYRVIFGAGTLNQVGEELQHVGRRGRVLSTPEQSGSAEELASKLGANAVGTFAQAVMHVPVATVDAAAALASALRSEEHTSELQSLMRISYAVFCLKKKTTQNKLTTLVKCYNTDNNTATHYTHL